MKITIYITILSLITFSCKEDVISDDITQNRVSESLLDSIYSYANEIYYWNDYLLDYNVVKKKRQFNLSEHQSIYNELINITSKAVNPLTDKPFDCLDNQKLKYTSFIDNRANSVDENSGYGISFSSFKDNDIRVQYVINGSTAYDKGIRRGMRLLSINNIAAETNEVFYSYLKKMLSADKCDIILEYNNAIINVHLLNERVKFNPILKDTILDFSGSKIGYLAYLSFQNSPIFLQDISDVFFKYERAHVEKLIIDLRYNQGGYISMVDYLANRLIPISYDGALMRYEEYNNCMQNGHATILKHQKISYLGSPLTLYDYDYSVDNNTVYFNKTTSQTNVKEIVFIVSNITASAGELLINVLKPYMPIVIIGVNNGDNNAVYTYGKPVGSIGINISHYTFYLPMFRNYNSMNDGDYFNGIKADVTIFDDLSHDFADHNEMSILKCLEIFGFTSRSNLKDISYDNYKIDAINNIELPNLLIKDY